MWPTSKDIAKRVGVSRTLVSFYLNDHPLAARISAKTKQKIEEAIKELNYKPSAAARTLKSGKSKTLGLVIGDIFSDFSSFFVQSLLNECSRLGYQMLIGITRFDPEEERRCLENIISRQADGIFYGMGIFPADYLLSAGLKDYPILQLRSAHPAFNSVGRAESPILKKAVRNLHDRGCRAIAVPHAAWLAMIERDAAEYGMRIIRGNPKLSHQEDFDRIRDARPDAVLATSSIYIRLLIKSYEQAGIAEVPRFFYSYSLPCDHIENAGVVGVAAADFKAEIAGTAERMVQMLEAPDGEIRRIEFPVRHLTREQMLDYGRQQAGDPFYAPFHYGTRVSMAALF